MRLSTTFIAIGLLALMGTAYASPAEGDNEDAASVDALQEDLTVDADNGPLERRSYYRPHHSRYGSFCPTFTQVAPPAMAPAPVMMRRSFYRRPHHLCSIFNPTGVPEMATSGLPDLGILGRRADAAPVEAASHKSHHHHHHHKGHRHHHKGHHHHKGYRHHHNGYGRHSVGYGRHYGYGHHGQYGGFSPINAGGLTPGGGLAGPIVGTGNGGLDLTLPVL